MDDIKFGEILLRAMRPEQQKRAEKVKARFWPVFKRAVRQLPFARDVVAAFYCAFDPDTPVRVRGVLLRRSPISSCPSTWCPIFSP